MKFCVNCKHFGANSHPNSYVSASPVLIPCHNENVYSMDEPVYLVTGKKIKMPAGRAREAYSLSPTEHKNFCHKEAIHYEEKL